MLANLPVVKSTSARTWFLATAALTAAILFWIHKLGLYGLKDVSGIFYWLLVSYDHTGAMIALLIVLGAIFFPYRFPVQCILQWIHVHAIAIAVVSAVLMAAGTLSIYHNHPLSMDEYAPFFQSQVFAAGKLTGQFPPALLDWLVPQPFQNTFLNVSHTTGAVASSYWPSFALLLTPFTALGIPWALNPLIAAGSLIAIHRLALRLFESKETAGLALLFAAASPALFANGISYYSMATHLLANSVFAILVLQPTAKRLFVAGVIGSIALTLHNPLPHVLFAIPWAIWLARKQGIKFLAILALGYLPLSLILGVGWSWISTTLFDSSVVVESKTFIGHIASAFTLPSTHLLHLRLLGFAKIWLWAVPGLFLLAIVGSWKTRADSRVLALTTSALLTLIGFLFVPFDQGHGWGFRYFHSAWMVLPVLGAAALTRFDNTERTATTGKREGAKIFFIAVALLTLTAGIGLRALQMQEFMQAHLRQMPHSATARNRIVIIDPKFSLYAYDLVQNDPFLRGKVIRMISHDRRANDLMMQKYFPDYRLISADFHGEVWVPAAAEVAIER